jgi:hypothetical protein
MKRILTLLAMASAFLMLTPTTAEAGHRRHRHSHASVHRHHHHHYRPYVYRVRSYCPPPVVYRSAYCAPRYSYGGYYGYVAPPAVHLSFGFGGRYCR